MGFDFLEQARRIIGINSISGRGTVAIAEHVAGQLGQARVGETGEEAADPDRRDRATPVVAHDALHEPAALDRLRDGVFRPTGQPSLLAARGVLAEGERTRWLVRIAHGLNRGCSIGTPTVNQAGAG